MAVRNTGSRKTVYVAMSGGVDSSVAAALLKKHGYQVVGVFMKPWSPEANPKSQIPNLKQTPNPNFQNLNVCLWKEDREDVLRVASVLDIPLLTWDFSKEYGRKVTQYMIDGYRKGITPNPDVMCNKEIKFGLFLKKALAEGADFVATGHYVRLRRKRKTQDEKRKTTTENSKLLAGVDKNKDQSYFLWTLTQEQLRYCLFPIGDHTKPQVRAMAKKFKLPVADKKDSQGVCFVGELEMHNFLTRYIKQKKGFIYHLDGRKIGEHDGAYYYTIGQRHGLDIKDGGGPYFVVDKDMRKNIIYVGNEKDLLSQTARVKNIGGVNGGPKLPAKVDVKIRYRSASVPATLHRVGTLRSTLYALRFSHPVRAITPGQSAVFYKGSEMLGGGIIY